MPPRADPVLEPKYRPQPVDAAYSRSAANGSAERHARGHWSAAGSDPAATRIDERVVRQRDTRPTRRRERGHRRPSIWLRRIRGRLRDARRPRLPTITLSTGTTSTVTQSGAARRADRSPRPRPSRPVQRAVAVATGQRGAGAADRGAPGGPSEGRHPAAAARVRHGRAVAHGSIPQVRRPVHHAPARGRDDPRQPRHGHDDPGRRAAARHHRGHRLLARTRCAPTSVAKSRCWSTA